MSNRTDPKQPTEFTPLDKSAILQAAAAAAAVAAADRSYDRTLSSGMKRLAFLWGLMLLCMVFGGWWFFKTQVEEAKAFAVDVNETIARLKADSIASWRAERVADAAVLSGSFFLIQGIDDWMQSPTAEDTEMILGRFKTMRQNYKYSDVLLVDASGNVKLSLSGEPRILGKETLQILSSGIDNHQTDMTDLYIDPATGKPRLDLVVHLDRYISGQEKCIGAVILAVDPEVSLYPKIRQMPILAKTAETLIVRRDGDSVLWLNDLRFKNGTALKKRESLEEVDRPAVMAVLGKKGAFEGIDYRGKKVVSFLTEIPNSPWFMVSKIDYDEIFGRVRHRVRAYFVVLALFLIGAGVLTTMMRHRLRQYKTLLEKEREIAKGAVKLEIAYKELEAFSYSVSHDLRGPLRSVEGFCTVLFKDHGDKLDNSAKESLYRVRSAAREMETIIDDLLELARVSRTEMYFDRVDLSQIAEEVVYSLRERGSERKVEVFIKQNLIVRGDVHLLTLALRNMIDNAWKFTSKNPSAKIEFGSTEIKGENVYFVRDNGAGFDQTYYNKLFNPFIRLHSEAEFPGTGIGLVVIKRIIERHNGRVWAESEVGKGTTFYFTISEKGGGIC